MTVLRSYLGGEWVSGQGPGAPLLDPTTGATLAHASSVGLDLRAALEHARRVGGPTLRAMSFAERGAMLAKAAKAVHAQREELVALALANGGNTRGDAKFDLDGATGTMMHYAKLGGTMGDLGFAVEDEVAQLAPNPRYVGRHVRVPLVGVAVHINAFNFPAWGLMEKAAVAWLAGVPVLSKPATSTALVAQRIGELLAEVLPDGVFSLLIGGAGDLLDHVQLGDAVAFTGSSAVGAAIRAQVGARARVNVEADSLNAAVLGPDVADDSDAYELFVRETAREMTLKAGQKCTATRRIFVPADRIDDVGADLAECLDEVKAGAPDHAGVRLGPLATPQQHADVRAGIAQLATACSFVRGTGGRGALLGVDGDGGCFVEATLLRAPALDTPVVHALEVFGPVATLIPYDGSAAQAVRGVALGQGSLVASVYTNDRDFAREVVLGLAPYSGRVTLGDDRVAEHSPGPGTVMPAMVHGGPGRAGGGEELGGERGLAFYQQRTAIQGSKALLEKILA